MRYGIRSLAAVGMVLTAMACGGSDGPSGPESASATLTGTYTLKTVNGSQIPMTLVSVPGYSVRINSSSLVMNSNNTFTGASNYTETESGVTATYSESCSGTFSRNGNSVAFTEAAAANTECGGSYTGTWDGAAKVTIAFDATVQAVFEK